ncbi:PD-(D/E)XK nuclease-like domain-containing protein [Gracilibacillus dipsosauri]|nr:PD-(D/E)XK nuclease-like domain-containing protein [Gracilibacillus dipsosauri]
MANKLVLTSENYYTKEADMQYMSVSQLKNWLECEARTLAELKGIYERPPNKAMIVGNYVHAAFEDMAKFSQFIDENNHIIFKRDGQKYAEFAQADDMIDTLKNDKFSMFAMEGEKEKIYTANWLGIDWKIKIDSINHDRQYFSDLKTCRDLNSRYYSEKYSEYVSFVEHWGYLMQMAVYRKIIELSTGQLYTPYIVAVTKESPPNKAVIHFDESRYEFEYDFIENELDRIIRVKNGEAEPVKCGKCEYCRQSKKLEGTIEVGELIYL